MTVGHSMVDPKNEALRGNPWLNPRNTVAGLPDNLPQDFQVPLILTCLASLHTSSHAFAPSTA